MHNLVLHVSNLVGDETVKALVDAALRPLTNLISQQIGRRLGIPVGDSDDMRVESRRLSESVRALELELERGRLDWGVASEEVLEPSMRRFVASAFDLSANTTLESKRLLAGILIARRLEAKTDSDDEILLRRTLTTIEDLTENQLRILAAALVVQGPVLPEGQGPFDTRDDAEKYLRSVYLPLADDLVKTLCFDEHEFGSLVSVGAIRLEDEGNALLVSESVAPFDQWLQRYAGDIHEVLEGEWGTAESHAAYRKRFPTINLLGLLASGSEVSEEYRGRRLDNVILTPLGISIGDLVLEQLLDAIPASRRTPE